MSVIKVIGENKVIKVTEEKVLIISAIPPSVQNKLDSVVAGTNVTIDNTDAKNPIISATVPASSGDMTKAVYDTDNNGVVDNADKVSGLTVETAVPIGAVFTDTVYDSTSVDAHIADITTNPHSVDKTDVGLSNVDNTSDANKPISTATQTALASKLETTDIDTLAELNTIITDATLIDTNDSRLSDDRTPLAHNHVETDITDFQTSVTNNTAVLANTAKVGVTVEEQNTINTELEAGMTGEDLVLNVLSLTTAEYTAGTPIATTFYIITDA